MLKYSSISPNDAGVPTLNPKRRLIVQVRRTAVGKEMALSTTGCRSKISIPRRIIAASVVKPANPASKNMKCCRFKTSNHVNFT